MIVADFRFIKQCHKFLDHRMVDFLAGDELAVVETEAIIQQQLNVGDNQFARMLVNGAVQFLLYQDIQTKIHENYCPLTSPKFPRNPNKQ